MKLVIVNGGPRQYMNTATLLKKAKEGAESQGAEVEYVNLYEYDFTGCRSCFACKIKDARTDGLCVVKDGVRPLLEKILKADGVIFGSPVYYDNITGQLRSMLERLWYPRPSNKKGPDGKMIIHTIDIPCAFIYTMNCPEPLMERIYKPFFDMMEWRCREFFGHYEALYSCDTFQFDDYDDYDVNMFDKNMKAEHKAKQWPIDCDKAYKLGVNIFKERKL